MQNDDQFVRQIATRRRRIERHRREGDSSFWQALGVTGGVGFMVMLPTLGGVMLGRWLDREHPAAFSWTFNLLVLGLILGCIGAWRMASRSGVEIDEAERAAKKDREAKK